MKSQEIKLDYEDVQVSESMKELILSMLKFDVKDRLKWSDFYKHPIFQKKTEPQIIEKLDIQSVRNHLRAEVYTAAEQQLTNSPSSQFCHVGSRINWRPDQM